MATRRRENWIFGPALVRLFQLHEATFWQIFTFCQQQRNFRVSNIHASTTAKHWSYEEDHASLLCSPLGMDKEGRIIIPWEKFSRRRLKLERLGAWSTRSELKSNIDWRRWHKYTIKQGFTLILVVESTNIQDRSVQVNFGAGDCRLSQHTLENFLSSPLV